MGNRVDVGFEVLEDCPRLKGMHRCSLSAVIKQAKFGRSSMTSFTSAFHCFCVVLPFTAFAFALQACKGFALGLYLCLNSLC